MSIKGFFPTGYHLMPAPYVQAYFFLPRLNLHGLISFMIDTGSDNTTLSLIDVERLNISYRRLRRTLIGVEGIAGEQSFYQEDALIMFREEEATTYMFFVDVHIPKKSRYSNEREMQRRLPSILGRDIINQCGLAINYQNGTIELTPPEGARRPVPTRRLL
jgi:hypothetical protein